MLRIPRPWLLMAAMAGLTVAMASASLVRRSLLPRHATTVLYEPDTRCNSRIEAKRRIIDAVIARRLSLLQAAADFRSADCRSQRACCLRAVFPYAASEDEAYCRSVIAWVFAKTPPEQAGSLANRLQCELDARLRNGELRLPPADDPDE